MRCFNGWISHDSERVDVIGLLNIYQTFDEENVLTLDIVHQYEKSWVILTDLDYQAIEEYPMSKVLNGEVIEEYINSTEIEKEGFSIKDNDFSLDFKEKLKEVFGEGYLDNKRGIDYVDLTKLNNENRLFSKDNDIFVDVKERFLESLEFEIERIKNGVPKYKTNMDALKDMSLVDYYEKILSEEEPMVEIDFLKSLIGVRSGECELVRKNEILDKFVSKNVGFFAGDSSHLPALEVFNVGTKTDHEKAFAELQKAGENLKHEVIMHNNHCCYYRFYVELPVDYDVEDAYGLSRILKHYGEKDFTDPNTLTVKDYRDYKDEK